jgi:hypothetical protein
MLHDVAAYLSPRAEQSVTQLADSKGREAPKKAPFKIRIRLQTLAAFAVLRRSAYPMAEL